jgi:hypothetical protein
MAMPDSSDKGFLKPVELHFTRTNGPVDDTIDQLMAQVGDIAHADIVREIILAGLKAGQENGGRADLKLMNSSMKEMRFTAKVFGPYRRYVKCQCSVRPGHGLMHPCTTWQRTWEKSLPMPDSW